jgi:hypothetical protein
VCGLKKSWKLCNTYHDVAHQRISYGEARDIGRRALKTRLLDLVSCFVDHCLVSARTLIEKVVSFAYQLIAMVFHEGRGRSIRQLVARGILAMDVFDWFFASNLPIVSMVALWWGRPLARIARTWRRGRVVKAVNRTIRTIGVAVVVTIIVRIVAVIQIHDLCR